MAIIKICPYCHQKYDISEKHLCDKKLLVQREREKHHRAVTKLADKPLHSVRWRKLRKKIIRLDGGYCQRCFKKYGIYTYEQLEPHHIIPRVQRPDLAFDENNIVTVCKKCNLELGLNGIDFDWSPNERDKEEYHL